MTTFLEKLHAAQERNNSWLCVGLDPDPERMPENISIEDFCEGIIQATEDLVCAYKPNLAFFMAHGSAGARILEEVISLIPAQIPVLLDAKVGDIGNTQRMYGEMAFGQWGLDAMTVSPYVGVDTAAPILEEFPGRGLFVLCRTSNPGSGAVQTTTTPPLYEHIAQLVTGWSEEIEGTLGLVVGATRPEELPAVRALAPNQPFLIPGIGSQGGSLESAVAHGATQSGIGPLINASRSVLYASGEEDFADAAREATLALRDEINQLRKVTHEAG